MRADELKPTINDTGFGYITIKGSKIEHDIVIRLSGEINPNPSMRRITPARIIAATATAKGVLAYFLIKISYDVYFFTKRYVSWVFSKISLIELTCTYITSWLDCPVLADHLALVQLRIDCLKYFD